MIRWLVQTIADQPDLTAGRPPRGLLTPAEAATYAALISPRRRRDWLLGRWTAKRLVQTHILATKGFAPMLDSFTVEHDAAGAPFLASLHPALSSAVDDQRLPLALSISHSHGYALCALSDNTTGNLTGHVYLGADIELVEPRPSSFIQEFFTTTEQARLNTLPPHQRDLLTTAHWSAKEAVLKATRQGLHIDPRTVECNIPPAPPRHWTRLSVQIQPAQRAQFAIAAPLRLWWRVIDNRLLPGTQFVLTLAAFGATL